MIGIKPIFNKLVTSINWLLRYFVYLCRGVFLVLDLSSLKGGGSVGKRNKGGKRDEKGFGRERRVNGTYYRGKREDG